METRCMTRKTYAHVILKLKGEPIRVRWKSRSSAGSPEASWTLRDAEAAAADGA
jgi:hypothetical protein